MNTIILIGMTGTGKSPFIREYSNGRNLFVFDVQNEYGSRVKYEGQQPMLLSDNINAPRARHTALDENLFIKQCSMKQNTVCVFEEATGFFEGRTSKEMRRLLVSKLFTRNVYILVFHSISSVPPRIMQFADYVVLFHTNDEAYQVEDKFPSLYPYFLKLKEMPKGQKLIIKTLPQ